MSLTDEVVLVTGASRGIGRSVAQLFAEAGARVAIHYNRDRAAAERTLALLDGGPHGLYRADVGDAEQVRGLADQVVAEMGAIHTLVNNAGIFEKHRFAELDYEGWRTAWDRTLAANLIGPANLCFCVGRQMMASGGGRIINISSRGAFRGEPEAPAYGVSKAGLNALSQSLAKALAPHGVFVYVVAPGWVDTDMSSEHLAGPDGDSIRQQSPLGRVARPDEIARAVVFLASGGTDYMTGCIIDVNGASYLRS